MVSSTLKALGCLVFALSVPVSAQQPTKKATSSISGKVTLKGKGIAGIPVGARLRQSSGRENALRGAVTDAQGNYRISNVQPGTYEIGSGAQQYVSTGYESVKVLIVDEGENYENVDFALVRGGVITGRITNSEGQPVVEHQVIVSGPLGNSQWSGQVSTSSDDRGIYRVFGLSPGKYQVSAGIREEDMNLGLAAWEKYKQVFYAGTADPKKATLVEVTEGGEATNIDITLRRIQATFAVSGKIVDADTGRPIANAVYGLTKYRDNGSSSSSGMSSTTQGEFRFDNLTPGNYAAFVEHSPILDLYAEPVKFEVRDQDIKGLVINASTGSSVSGVIVLDGIDPKLAGSQLRGMMVWLKPASDEEPFPSGRTAAVVNHDGRFQLNGVRPGVIQFTVYANSSGDLKAGDLTRIERNGVVEAQGVEVKAGEKVTGLRLIVKLHKGGIRGVVKFENRELRAKNGCT